MNNPPRYTPTSLGGMTSGPSNGHSAGAGLSALVAEATKSHASAPDRSQVYRAHANDTASHNTEERLEYLRLAYNAERGNEGRPIKPPCVKWKVLDGASDKLKAAVGDMEKKTTIWGIHSKESRMDELKIAIKDAKI